MRTFKAHWAQLIAREHSGYEEIAGDDPFANWDRLIRPDIAVEQPLCHALELACGDGDHGLISRFIDQCLQMADRCLREDIFSRDRCRDDFPLNRARVIRARAYSAWLRTGQVDEGSVRASVDDFSVWMGSVPDSDWDEVAMKNLLSGLSLALLVGHASTRAILLAGSARFQGVPRFEVLRRSGLLILGEREGTPLPQGVFDASFDAVRSPGTSGMISSFEMGYVRQLAFPLTAGRPDPWEAVRLLSN